MNKKKLSTQLMYIVTQVANLGPTQCVSGLMSLYRSWCLKVNSLFDKKSKIIISIENILRTKGPRYKFTTEECPY